MFEKELTTGKVQNQICFAETPYGKLLGIAHQTDCFVSHMYERCVPQIPMRGIVRDIQSRHHRNFSLRLLELQSRSS